MTELDLAMRPLQDAIIWRLYEHATIPVDYSLTILPPRLYGLCPTIQASLSGSFVLSCRRNGTHAGKRETSTGGRILSSTRPAASDRDPGRTDREICQHAEFTKVVGEFSEFQRPDSFEKPLRSLS